MQRKTLEIMHRGYSSYLDVKNESDEGSTLQRAVLRAGNGADKSDTVLSTCVIDDDWLLKIEEALPFIERAVKENRQFILRQEETVPIEKARRVSKTSVEHLARHSQMIKREPEPGEDIIPEKILMTENVGTYAVYENRFLYMLLCYIKDFSKIKYAHISENSYLFSAETQISKTVSDKNRRISFELRYKEVSSDSAPDDVKKKLLEDLQRINTVIDEVDALLGTGLMVEVSNAPVLKPPIVRTNVLLQNTCFSKALQLYDYLVAYTKSGYEIKELFRKEGEPDEDARADYAELVALTSYLTYRNGGLFGELEESRRESEALKLLKERQKRLERIGELKKKLKDLTPEVLAYVEALEEECVSCAEQVRVLQDGKDRMSEAREILKDAEKIKESALREKEEMSSRLLQSEETVRRLSEELKGEKQLCDAKLNQKSAELERVYANHKEEIEKIGADFKAEYKALLDEYHLISALVRADALCNEGGEEGKGLTKEEFLRLEAEYSAFKKYFEACWKDTKRNIRREKLWKK